MLDIVKSMFTMGIILGFYAIFGMLASQVFRLKYSAGRTLLIGFFVYHGIFQLIAFPLICLKQPLSLLTGCWMAVLATALVWFVLVLRKREKWRFAWKRDYGFLCALTAMILLAAFQYYYVVRIPYHGWDTAFYVGTVHQSVVSNTMYIYNGTTGRPAEVINMRYALSSFYMHEAVWCQLLKIHPILFGKYAIAGMGAILSNVVVYQIAGLFFKEKKKRFTAA